MTTCPKCGHKWGETPVPTTEAFPHKIVFEKESDEGYGNVGIVLFPTLADADVSFVSVNGEVATKATPYRGHPVFTLSKNGGLYPLPLKFVVKTPDGKSYVASYNETADTPAGPTGGNSETVKPSSYGNGDRGNARFSKPGAAYGKNIQVYIDGALKMTVADGSKRQEGRNGLIWKPISDNNGKLVVVGEYKVHYGSCTIKW